VPLFLGVTAASSPGAKGTPLRGLGA